MIIAPPLYRRIAWLLLALSVLCAPSGTLAEEISAGESGVEEIYVTVGILDVDSISSAAQSFTINVLVQFRWFDPALAHDGEGNIRRDLSDISAPR